MIILGMVTACGSVSQPPPLPIRQFTEAQLLLTPSDLPSGWKVTYYSYPSNDHYGIGASVRFESPDALIGGLTQDVYRYSSATAAKNTYEVKILPNMAHLDPPIGWTYHSSAASFSAFGCYHYADATSTSCQWSAVYEEYIVIVRAPLAPELGWTFADLERVIGAVDGIMIQHLRQP